MDKISVKLNEKTTVESFLETWISEIVDVAAVKMPQILKSNGQKSEIHDGSFDNYFAKTVRSRSEYDRLITAFTPTMNLKKGTVDWKLVFFKDGDIAESYEKSFRWTVPAGTQVKWLLDQLTKSAKNLL